MPEPTIHEGLMWLGKKNEPWFAVQVSTKQAVHGEVKITNNPDQPVAYFTIDYIAAQTAPAHAEAAHAHVAAADAAMADVAVVEAAVAEEKLRTTDTDRGVSVVWGNTLGEDLYLRISMGYEQQTDNNIQLPDGHQFASPSCHINLASPSNPGSTEGGHQGGHDEHAGHDHGGDAMSPLSTWDGVLKFELATFALKEKTGWGESDKLKFPLELERKLYFHGENGWTPIEAQRDSTHLTIDTAVTGAGVPTGMYVLGVLPNP